MKFISITKPGIIFGNLITVLGGFFMGSQYAFDGVLLLWTWIGMACVIACGCVLNNYIDRDIDPLMERTKDRVLARGLMPLRTALRYAAALGIVGFLILLFAVNVLTALVAAVGLVVYVLAYSLYVKRTSVYGTVIGSIAGAMPPIAGYCAATDTMDTGALLLFLILFFWQIPHFYAIAIYRLSDYQAASIPVLPATKDMIYTKVSMFVCTIAFTIAAILPTVFDYVGWVYFIVALALGGVWIYFSWQGFAVSDNKQWARKMFLFSILTIMLLSLALSVKT